MDGAAVAIADGPPELSEGEPAVVASSDVYANRPSPEELVARAIAPIKADFLRPPPVRPNPRAAADDEDDEKEKKGSTPSAVVKEKKSRRQVKRERKQEQASAANICPEVSRSGSSDTCPYGTSCRFSHDLEAYLAQKPPDLEGTCPFTLLGRACRYGRACRFLNTHIVDSSSDQGDCLVENAEMNSLSKDVQKLLWKSKFPFPRADAQLFLLGLKDGAMNGKLKREAGHEMCDNNQEVAESSVFDDEANHASDDSRLPKKIKNDVDKDHKDGNVDVLCSEKLGFVGSGASDGHAEGPPEKDSKIHAREKKIIDFRGKLYLAPLTTVGNLPFRRVCKLLGADITCGEMAMCTNLLQGQASEWALLRRHSSENLFGVQLCGAYPDTIARAVELVDDQCSIDFIDINMGCPIDIVVNKGAGSSLLTKPSRMKSIVQAASSTIDKPLTIKVRTGFFEGKNRIDTLVSDMQNWGVAALTIHGRSRQQRYSKLADWNYVYQCAEKAPEVLHVIGNGDVFSFSDWHKHYSQCPKLSTCMIARGALIKPWIFTEIKEQRDWDITAEERFNILKDFVRFGLEHWGSDSKGVETTRHFLLEWLSYTYRYVPTGLLEIIPQRLNWRPPSYFGRNELETLMASDSAADWIRISEMLLGKVPDGFSFAPKHKSNAYDRSENG